MHTVLLNSTWKYHMISSYNPVICIYSFKGYYTWKLQTHRLVWKKKNTCKVAICLSSANQNVPCKCSRHVFFPCYHTQFTVELTCMPQRERSEYRFHNRDCSKVDRKSTKYKVSLHFETILKETERYKLLLPSFDAHFKRLFNYFTSRWCSIYIFL